MTDERQPTYDITITADTSRFRAAMRAASGSTEFMAWRIDGFTAQVRDLALTPPVRDAWEAFGR